MAETFSIKKRTHKHCGGEIEIIALRESFRDLIRCKKCGDNWKMPLDESEEGTKIN